MEILDVYDVPKIICQFIVASVFPFCENCIIYYYDLKTEPIFVKDY